MDRMPPIEEQELTAEQRLAVAEISAGPRGGLVGPFVPLLRSPELMSRVQRVGEFLRFGSTLEAAVREVAILTVARHWDQAFEWAFHRPIALEAGVPEDLIRRVERHEAPDPAAEHLRLTWEVAEELHHERGVSDGTYARAVSIWGEQGTVELVGCLGYYGLLAMVMNTARTPPPPGSRGPQPLTQV